MYKTKHNSSTICTCTLYNKCLNLFKILNMWTLRGLFQLYLNKFEFHFSRLHVNKINNFCFLLNNRRVSYICLFVFVALRPMSTAMVIAGRSVPACASG